MNWLPGRPGDQACAASNLSLLDHLQYDSSSLAGLCLTNKTLRSIARFESVSINTKTADVRVRGDQIDTLELFALGDSDNGLHGVALAGPPTPEGNARRKAEHTNVPQPWFSKPLRLNKRWQGDRSGDDNGAV